MSTGLPKESQECNGPFAGKGHVFRYRMTTPCWRASTLAVSRKQWSSIGF